MAGINKGLIITALCFLVIYSTEGFSAENITVVNRTCANEPPVAPSHIPDDICKPTKDSCKHVMVNIKDDYQVLCDTETDNGGWIVIQRRPTATDFHTRNLTDFQAGFGEIDDTFWFGLENIHRLCPKQKPCEMRVDIISQDGQESFGTYSSFAVSGAWEQYKVTVSGFSGQGDLMNSTNGMKFVAEGSPDMTPAEQSCLGSSGPWWFDEACSTETLNGANVAKKNMYTEMKIRQPKSQNVKA